MKRKTRISLAIAAALVVMSGCGNSDTYDFAVKQGLFSAAHWSFESGSDMFSKSLRAKGWFKSGSGLSARGEYSIPLYNRTDVRVDQMRAEFSNGTLWLNSVSLTSGTTFNVEGAKQLTFTFKPTVTDGKAAVSFYTHVEGLEKQISIYTLELYKNLPPAASFTVKPSTAGEASKFDYVFDASASVDGDAADGGRLYSYTYTVTDEAMASQTIPLLTGDTWDQNKVYSFTFPGTGRFTVKLVVKDSDGDTAEAPLQTVVIQ